jgi:hypothetical protein
LIQEHEDIASFPLDIKGDILQPAQMEEISNVNFLDILMRDIRDIEAMAAVANELFQK